MILRFSSPTPNISFQYSFFTSFPPGIVNGIGVLGLLLWPVFRTVTAASYFLLLLGVFTALVGTSQARVRADVKGRLAASTTMQMGYLAVQVALGLPAPTFAHLVGHGLWKAGLFLQAGGAVERVRAAADHHVHVSWIL